MALTAQDLRPTKSNKENARMNVNSAANRLQEAFLPKHQL